MRIRLCLAVLVSALVAVSGFACGGGDDDAPTATSSVFRSSGSPPADVADQGCTVAYPDRVRNTGRLAGQFVTCSDDEGRLRLRNTSSFVLRVQGDSSGAALSAAFPAATGSFADEMVEQTVPTTCVTTNICLMPPRAEVVADGYRARVSVDVAPAATATATAAATFGGWVASKLRTRAQSYALSISACADAVGDVSSQFTYIEDAMRHAVETGTSCASLYRDVMSELQQAPPPATTATDDVLRLANRFGGNLKKDLAVIAAIRVAASVR